MNSSSEVYAVDLDVRLGTDDVVRRTVEWTVFDVARADVQAGAVLDVTVDPDRPSIVYPPGYPPPGFDPGVIALGDARILPTSKWLDEQLS